MKSIPIHHRMSHPVVVSVVLLTAIVALSFAWLPSRAATTSVATITRDAYSFRYPSSWSTTLTTKSVIVRPPASTVATWKKKGISYSASTAVITNDNSVLTATLKTALKKKQWSSIAATYAKQEGKKLGATTNVATTSISGWKASTITWTKRTKGVLTTWKTILMTKDYRTVYAVREQWTKQVSSPAGSALNAVAKSLTPFSSVKWAFNGSTWNVTGTPPTCGTPLVARSPVDVTQATSILYPGQVRGGNYKPHGGFRFDTKTDNTLTVVAPADAMVVSGARYIESGEVQYLFDLQTPCGIRYRFDHLLTLSDTFQAIANTFMTPQVDDTRTNTIAQPVSIKAGTTIATEIGVRSTHNYFIDFGVYDLRQKNSISENSTWAAEHDGVREMGWYGICWLRHLPVVDVSIVEALPGADGVLGKTSDYCI